MAPVSFVHIYRESNSFLRQASSMPAEMHLLICGFIWPPHCKEGWETGVKMTMIDVDLGTGPQPSEHN